LRGELKKKVKVVGGTACFDDSESLALSDGAEVGEEGVPAVGRDEESALLCAEDPVMRIFA